MTAPKEIKTLVERFERNRQAYRSSEYNETQLRREFIDPFFKALGWDIDNKRGYAKTDHDKKLIQRQIEQTDKRIDQLVYELYGLTDKEIKIVEEATR
jgi:predicted type IV restriction endonuclease